MDRSRNLLSPRSSYRAEPRVTSRTTGPKQPRRILEPAGLLSPAFVDPLEPPRRGASLNAFVSAAGYLGVSFSPAEPRSLACHFYSSGLGEEPVRQPNRYLDPSVHRGPVGATLRLRLLSAGLPASTLAVSESAYRGTLTLPRSVSPRSSSSFEKLRKGSRNFRAKSVKDGPDPSRTPFPERSAHAAVIRLSISARSPGEFVSGLA